MNKRRRIKVMQDFVNKLLEQPACVIVRADKINGLIERLGALGYKVNGDISVLQIILPEFSSENKALQAKVMFNASFEDDTDSLFYILSSSDSTDYAFGCITSSEMNIKERVVFGNLEVPNIPAVYQMKCNSIRFVTPETYNASISKIRGKQKNLREEFYDVNNIYQQSN
jgi:hypothetical protein